MYQGSVSELCMKGPYVLGKGPWAKIKQAI